MKKYSTLPTLNRTFLWQKLLRITTLATVVGALVNVPAALGWKPTTHVYLAEQALVDALDDGKVTINRVDFEKGEVTNEIIGQYEVDKNILAALRAYPAQYRAGALGPDAYPDMLTGQQVIHPNGALTTQPWGVEDFTVLDADGNAIAFYEPLASC
jgi:hypothetical protein